MSRISSGQRHYAKGYVLMISVIIIGAVAASVAASLLLLGSADAKNAISQRQAVLAKAAANACAEEALEQVRENQNFSGSGNLAVDGGACSYSVASSGGSNRTIAASSTVASVTRRVTVIVTAINPVIVAAWQETP